MFGCDIAVRHDPKVESRDDPSTVFRLQRVVPQHEVQHGFPGRRVSQLVHRLYRAGDDELVARQVDAGASAGLAAAGAAASLGASDDGAEVSDLAFSSFIIGDALVTASFI